MTTTTYNYTGAQQKFTVPDQVTSVTATLIGGKGGGGANGGKTKATFNVTPGQILYVYVGGNGSLCSTTADANGGYNGGGKAFHQTSGSQAGSGGGSTDIRLGGTALSNRIIVAGGAGGRGAQGVGATSGLGGINYLGGTGGVGGANTGGDGGNEANFQANPGRGGTNSAGGAAGAGVGGSAGGTAGSSGTGGTGGHGTLTAQMGGQGGGGGAGYFGGGGGGQGPSSFAPDMDGGGGGGGGSNYIAATINSAAPTATTNTANDPGTPSVVLTYNAKPVATAITPNSSAGVSTANTTATFTFTHVDDDAALPSAYQIVIERNSNGVSVLDTGKVTSTSKTPTLTIGSLPTDTDLRWKVKTWDSTGLAGDYSAYTIFQYGTPPSWTPSPANGATITNGQPTISWSDATAGYPGNPAGWTLTIAKVGGATAASASGTNFFTTKSYTPPTPILDNGSSYNITLTLTDTRGISRTQVSTVSVSYSQPASIRYNIYGDPTQQNGYILIDWSTANSDIAWTKWRVWRKLTSDTDWTLLYETTDNAQRQYQDWLISSGSVYQYTVTQVKVVSGTEVDSPLGYEDYGPDTSTYTVQYDNYWLIDVVNGVFSTYLPTVTASSIGDEFEAETYSLIGRGRKVDYGDRLGYIGSLNCQLRGYDGTPELIRSKLEGIKLSQDTVYLRSPFGDLFPVSLGQIDFNLVPGVGGVSMYDVSIPYSEVSGEIVEEVSLPVDITLVDNGDGTSTLSIANMTASVTNTSDNLTIVSF